MTPFAGGQTLAYTPQQLERAIQELTELVQEVSRRVQALENMMFLTRHTPQEKPRTPMIVYADGLHWNPGAGEGYYEFRSDNAWHKL